MSDASLQLRKRNGNEEPDRGDDGYVLRGEYEWLVRGTPGTINAIADAAIGISERFGDTALLLSFGNSVGFFDLPFIGRVEIVSGKWDRTHFDAMLAELTNIAAGLPFQADAAAGLPYHRDVPFHEDVLYHMFIYLRYILSENAPTPEQIVPALRLILRDPHQRFERLRREVTLEQVRRVDARTLTRLASDPRVTPVYSESHRSMPLVRALSGHLPQSVDEPYSEVTVDTPENRFVKMFLDTLSSIVDRMRDEIQRGKRRDAFVGRVYDDCTEMADTLRPIAQHAIWSQVGPVVQIPLSSPVLQRRRGYRDVFGHFAKLHLAARVPLSKDVVRDLLEAKDIAKLYEIWAYFALVRAIEHVHGPPRKAGRPAANATQITMPWDLSVVWADGTTLMYNPRFSRSRAGNRHSFSVPLRPDIGLDVPFGPNRGLHLFDAKFRVTHLADILPASDEENNIDANKDEERRGTFKRGDLYKMHTYRDAIPEARTVWILYPGSEFRYFSESGGSFPMLRTVPESVVTGVGAIPLSPGTDGEAIRAVLSTILRLN